MKPIWLKEKTEKTNLDRTSSAAVNVYNEKLEGTNGQIGLCIVLEKQSYSTWSCTKAQWQNNYLNHLNPLYIFIFRIQFVNVY